MPERIVVEVEQALGPGVEFERDMHGALVGRRVRCGGAWLGFDRAALVESDDGGGRGLAAIVSMPTSTWAGCRLEVELIGGWRAEGRIVVVARVPGSDVPARPIMLAAAGIVGSAEWLDRAAIDHIVREAYRRYRDRRSHARIQGGRAWYGIGSLSPELARFATPHSAAEYNLAKLPPRFVRGLEGLLDDDERLLYAIERPARIDVGLRERFRSSRDRRAALLLLTDRQVLWLVDHAAPDRYLLDWGVDVWIAPVEQVSAVRVAQGESHLVVSVATIDESIVAALPYELDAEADVFVRLLRRFTSAAAQNLPRRLYKVASIPFDLDPAAVFGQTEQARMILDAQRAHHAEPLAFLYSPTRDGQRQPAAVHVGDRGVNFIHDRDRRCLGFDELQSLTVVLSPLIGRIRANGDTHLAITYPATLGQQASGLIRLLRRVWANHAIT